MKNIFGFILFISLMTSCIVDYSDVRPVDSYRLQNYVEARRNEVIDVPLALMKTMLEFDAYIRMTDEERPSSSIFFGNYQEVNENVYSISAYDQKAQTNISMELYTRGTSVWDDKAIWLVHGFEYEGRYMGDVPQENDDVMEKGAELALLSAADSTWTLKVGENVAVKMKMHPRKNGLYRWTVTAQGVEHASDGITSEFGTVGTFNVQERMLEGYPYVRNYYEGQFNASIFRDGQPYDYCYVTYRFDQQATYKTSR